MSYAPAQQIIGSVQDTEGRIAAQRNNTPRAKEPGATSTSDGEVQRRKAEGRKSLRAAVRQTCETQQQVENVGCERTCRGSELWLRRLRWM